MRAVNVTAHTLSCREDYSHLYDFINTKNIRVKNKGKVGVWWGLEGVGCGV